MSSVILPPDDSHCQTLIEKQFLFLFHLREELPSSVWNIGHLSTGITKTSLTDLTDVERTKLIDHFAGRLDEVRL